MATGFIERMKSFILSPGKAFEKEHKTSVKESMIYGLIGFLIFAIPYTILFGILGILAAPVGLLLSIIMFVMIFIGGFLGALIGALWYHLCAYAFGARQGVKKTINAVYFAYTPVYILGWIPFVNLIAGIWSLILLGMGFQRLQKLSTGRAIGAILVAVLIPIIIVIAIMFWAIVTFGPEIFMNNETTSTFSVPY